MCSMRLCHRLGRKSWKLCRSHHRSACRIARWSRSLKLFTAFQWSESRKESLVDVPKIPQQVQNTQDQLHTVVETGSSSEPLNSCERICQPALNPVEVEKQRSSTLTWCHRCWFQQPRPSINSGGPRGAVHRHRGQHLLEHAEASAHGAEVRRSCTDTALDDEIVEVLRVMKRNVHTILQTLQKAVKWETSSIPQSNGGRSSRDTTIGACNRKGTVTYRAETGSDDPEGAGKTDV